MIPYGRQDINQEDIEAVTSVLRSEFITQGPWVPRFEEAVAQFCSAKFAVAVNSGTSALHIACKALDLGAGDILWTTPNTFVASANCALYCGAGVDFVDIDSATLNMCVTALEKKLIQAEKTGTLPKIIVPVHFAGQSCDMKAIRLLADKYGFKIIEDASHAIGGKYLEEFIGGCRYSDITVFSFHPVKIITTGEGGLLTTNSEELAARLQRYRSHGITREPVLMTKESEGPWYYQQLELGYNYRITDIQAALGWSQLKRIEQYVEQRNDIANYYSAHLNNLSVKVQHVHNYCRSAYHLYIVRIMLEQTDKSKKEVFLSLRDAGIGVNVHYIPVHTQPYYQKLGFKLGDFPVAEKYYSEAISIPMYPQLTQGQQDFVVEQLKAAIQ